MKPGSTFSPLFLKSPRTRMCGTFESVSAPKFWVWSWYSGWRSAAASSGSRHALEDRGLFEQRKVARVALHVEEADEGYFAFDATGEQRRHAVVVALADGVELVIVAARATDR